MKLGKIAAAAALAACVLLGCSKQTEDLSVMSEKKFELGETVSLDAADYLVEEPEDSSVLKDIEVDSDLKTSSDYTYNESTRTVTDSGKKYLGVGDYTITLKYGGKEYPVTLIVEDTTMPEFVSPAAVVTIPLGTDDFDFSSIYKVSDKDEVTLSVEGNYDTDTVGTYPVTLIATDASGNSNSIDITINVIGNSQVITPSNQFSNETTLPSDTEEEEEKTDEGKKDDTDDSAAAEQPKQDDTAQDTTTPSTGTDGGNACSISYVPDGMTAYRTFQEAYEAGTAWNQAASDHYFFYLEGSDDCGNKVYFVTFGTGNYSDVNQ